MSVTMSQTTAFLCRFKCTGEATARVAPSKARTVEERILKIELVSWLGFNLCCLRFEDVFTSFEEATFTGFKRRGCESKGEIETMSNGQHSCTGVILSKN
jgi:hypothetical protein